MFDAELFGDTDDHGAPRAVDDAAVVAAMVRAEVALLRALQTYWPRARRRRAARPPRWSGPRPASSSTPPTSGCAPAAPATPSSRW